MLPSFLTKMQGFCVALAAQYLSLISGSLTDPDSYSDPDPTTLTVIVILGQFCSLAPFLKIYKKFGGTLCCFCLIVADVMIVLCRQDA